MGGCRLSRAESCAIKPTLQTNGLCASQFCENFVCTKLRRHRGARGETTAPPLPPPPVGIIPRRIISGSLISGARRALPALSNVKFYVVATCWRSNPFSYFLLHKKYTTTTTSSPGRTKLRLGWSNRRM